MLGLKVVSLCGNARVIYPRVERLSAGGLLVEEHQLTRPVLGKNSSIMSNWGEKKEAF